MIDDKKAGIDGKSDNEIGYGRVVKNGVAGVRTYTKENPG